uniref:NADH dehydrogenase subunit 6 n=1 Tax=Orchesella cincta TaxID=48709 RepID=A0A1L2E0P6_ORCCI|nr:NADH dehydrogenase subunit 6 [Orchesella cincta]ANJ04203.1 NADH dehydrogenase subunit 6 [Orchesella cincta]
MYLFLSMSTMISISLMMVSHPIAILSLILMQTMNLCFLIWMLIKINWLPYILFLIFLGGLMVLFMYVTSLASNEKFEMNIEEMKTTAGMGSTVMFFSLLIVYFNFNMQPPLNILSQQNSMIFSSPVTYLTLIIMSFLLITLVVAVKITTKFEGPLRSIFHK